MSKKYKFEWTGEAGVSKTVVHRIGDADEAEALRQSFQRQVDADGMADRTIVTVRKAK